MLLIKILTIICNFLVLVRLVHGNSVREGRFEAHYKDIWGTVCGIGWGMHEGSAVCRQLGYDGAEAATPWPAFGGGSRMILVNRIQCGGNESSLSDCRFLRWKTNWNCGSFKGPGAVCKQSGNKHLS